MNQKVPLYRSNSQFEVQLSSENQNLYILRSYWYSNL